MLDGTNRQQTDPIRTAREQMAASHRRWVTDLDIARLVEVTGDPGLAADSIGMWPRPTWVEDLIGPFPASLELANPADVASVEEYGPLGEGT